MVFLTANSVNMPGYSKITSKLLCDKIVEGALNKVPVREVLGAAFFVLVSVMLKILGTRFSNKTTI